MGLTDSSVHNKSPTKRTVGQHNSDLLKLCISMNVAQLYMYLAIRGPNTPPSIRRPGSILQTLSKLTCCTCVAKLRLVLPKV